MYKLALRNLVRSRIRSVFTVLGIAAVMSLYVTMMSISRDINASLDNSLSRDVIDIVVQSRTSNTPLSSNIKEEDVVRLDAMPGVQSVSPLVIAARKKINGRSLFIFGALSLGQIADRMGIGLVKGRLIEPGTRQILIGQKAARYLRLDVGDTMDLGKDYSGTISGIYSLGANFLDGGIFLDLRWAQQFLRYEGRVNVVFLSVKPPSNVQDVIEAVHREFPKLYAVPSGELTRNVGPVSMIKTVLNAVAMIALCVSGIIVLNTMLMAISERTQEIGILMAIGWSQRMIVVMILMESITICVIGGIAGFGLAYLEFDLLHALPSVNPLWLPDAPLPDLFFEVILLSAFVGFISAAYPALFATRLQPAQALRYE